MTLKKFLMVSTVGCMLALPMSAHATCGASWKGICLFGDAVTAVANYLLHASEEKLMNPIIDVHAGLEKIKENIGMYQDKGICGRSATGASGCTEESSGSETEGYTGTDISTYTGTIDMMTSTLTGSLSAKTEKIEANGDIVANWNAVDKDYLDAIGATSEMDTFDKVRANIEAHVFESDSATINATCTCSQGTGDACSAPECAQHRQDRLLAVSSTGASADADGYLRDMTSRYATLRSAVSQINGGSNTVADFLGNLGILSVRGASTALEQMSILTYDLRAQSYRNLIFGGTQKEDLSSLEGGN